MDFSWIRSEVGFRSLVVVVIGLLVLPTVVAGLTYTDPLDSVNASGVNATSEQGITFVSAQGKEFSSDDARLVAFDRHDDVVWKNNKYSRYYDVDPLSNGRVLFVASAEGVEDSNYTGEFVTVIMNWHTGHVDDVFPVPHDTHDVDQLTPSTYAVADKADNKVYVYNRTTDETVWQYKFHDHFPPYPKAGGDDTGYTHVNDIDSIENGSAFLVSPRNFDRVMAINRSTKQVEWTLGEENNYSILNEQHNPELLATDPLTVLVADSENDRVVEYRRSDDDWTRDWTYTDLDWPRDADRLPNGNTMIADSGGNRALEVTPAGKVVWEADIQFGPYDVERPALGDEPTGPTMHEMGIDGRVVGGSANTDETRIQSMIRHITGPISYLYSAAQWVIPSWVSEFNFTLLLLVPLVVVGWGGIELSRTPSIKRATSRIRESDWERYTVFLSTGIYLVSGIVLVGLGFTGGQLDTLATAVGVLLFVEAIDRLGGVAAGIGRRWRTGTKIVRGGLGFVSVITISVLVGSTVQASNELRAIYVAVALLLLFKTIGKLENSTD